MVATDSDDSFHVKFVTVTANAAVDATYVLDRFTQGGINRVARVRAGPGGKGNNVALILARLGNSVVATGFAGGHAGSFIEEGLQRLGIRPAFVRVSAESRRCLTMIDRNSGVVTEVREPGEPITPGEAAALVRLVALEVADADAVAICGSVPPGLPPNFYTTLLAAVADSPAVTALDTSAESLRSGLAGGPNLIAPNASEMAELMGGTANRDEMVAFARQELIGTALPVESRVLLKLGADGAVLIGKHGVVDARPPVVQPVNTVGCGDALLAGFLSAVAQGRDPGEALRDAVAVGTAASLEEAIGEVDLAKVAAIRERVQIEVHGESPLETIRMRT